MTEPTPTEVQLDLFSILQPQSAAPEALVFDPMDIPGEPEFPRWDPHGENSFHGPLSD